MHLNDSLLPFAVPIFPLLPLFIVLFICLTPLLHTCAYIYTATLSSFQKSIAQYSVGRIWLLATILLTTHSAMERTWRTVTPSSKSKGLKNWQWESVLLDALHYIRYLPPAVTNATFCLHPTSVYYFIIIVPLLEHLVVSWIPKGSSFNKIPNSAGWILWNFPDVGKMYFEREIGDFI